MDTSEPGSSGPVGPEAALLHSGGEEGGLEEVIYVDDTTTRTQQLEQILEESRIISVPDRSRRAHRIVDDMRPRPVGAPYAYQEAAYNILTGDDQKINLLVASPTGSGKTNVIVKAAELAISRGEKFVVAEPLIALVEQVHAKLVKSFPGVAVDMRTGPSVKTTDGVDALIVVCTYEVLATMCSSVATTALHSLASLAGCTRVAIDEFHFIGEDRGPVIQEILDWCRKSSAAVIALSGTLINESEVGEFISGVNGFPTVIVGAANRPVPLTFFYYDVKWHSFSTLRARTPWERSCSQNPDFKTIGGLHTRQDVLQLVNGLRRWDCLPALLVTFSCRTLDRWAEDAASGGYNFLSRGKCSIVVGGFRDMLRDIAPEDRVLFERLERLARLGIGLHHSHLPVQYLELVSRLAEHRCLALVFSTSTLSAGINLPVRTVCLCSARLPRKTEEGDMSHEVIDPLLFHQLAGRAGRPGFETIGNVVVVGCAAEGWQAAAALLERPLTPVRPTSLFNSGDVLRAAQTGRCIALDRLVFSNSLAAKAAERLQLSKVICNRAMVLLAGDDGGHELIKIAKIAAESTRAIAAVPTALLREQHGLPCAISGEKTLWLLDLGRNGFRVVDEVREGALPLTRLATPGSNGHIKAPRSVHSSVFEAICELRRARLKLVEVWRTGVDENFWQAASVLRNTQDDAFALENDQDVDDYRKIESELKECGFLNPESGAPTRAGRAAALVRSSSKPEAIIKVLLMLTNEEEEDAAAELTRAAYLRLASLTLGAGVQADEPPEDASVFAPGEDLLRTELVGAVGGGVSAPSYNIATAMWAAGASLAQIDEETGVSCGQFARHAVRTNSLLCELGYARRELGLEPDPELAAASVSICRGLPFAKRGGGRVALGGEGIAGGDDDVIVP